MFDSPLENIRVASPCSANWSQMQGDDRKRFCGECKLNVYNLSGMTRYDAENLLRLSEGRLCVRYFQRADGTVLTKDCPIGWAKVKERVSIFAMAAFSLVVSIFGSIFIFSFLTRKVARPYMGAIAVSPRPAMGEAVMGNIAVPTPTPIPRRAKRIVGGG